MYSVPNDTGVVGGLRLASNLRFVFLVRVKDTIKRSPVKRAVLCLQLLRVNSQSHEFHKAVDNNAVTTGNKNSKFVVTQCVTECAMPRITARIQPVLLKR